MTQATARKLVLVSLTLMATLDEARASKEPGTLYRRLWGLALIGIILSAVADFLPEIAGPFALLMLLGKITHGGDRAIQSFFDGLVPKGGTKK